MVVFVFKCAGYEFETHVISAGVKLAQAQGSTMSKPPVAAGIVVGIRLAESVDDITELNVLVPSFVRSQLSTPEPGWEDAAQLLDEKAATITYYPW